MRPRRRNFPVAGEHPSRTCELHRSQTRRVVRATLLQRQLRSRSVFDWLCTESGRTRSSLCNLCVLCASVVHYCSEKTTTGAQSTQRLHREEAESRLSCNPFTTYLLLHLNTLRIFEKSSVQTSRAPLLNNGRASGSLASVPYSALFRASTTQCEGSFPFGCCGLRSSSERALRFRLFARSA